MGKKERQKGKRENAQPASPAIEPRVSFMGYVILNLIFWAYCALQLLVLKWLLRDIAGLYIFFAILAIAFTIVSLYDFIYDRLSSVPGNPRSPNKSS